jgi:hypothetical protein
MGIPCIGYDEKRFNGIAVEFRYGTLLVQLMEYVRD